MRLPLLAVALLVVFAVPAGAVGTPAPSADAGVGSTTATQSTLSGTVSHLNGTPVSGATVLVGTQSRFENASTDDLRALAADPPDDVASATTDSDGSYTLTVNDSVEAEAVIAVSSEGVSQLRRYQSGELDLTLRTTEPLTFESQAVTSEPGGRATVTFSLEHTGDQAVEGLKLTLGSLPNGWNVARSTTDTGTYHEANRTFTWGTVESGASVTAELTLFVAIEAIDDEAERFSFPMFAGSNTHPVSADNIEITVQYPTERPERTQTDIPGLGAPAAVAALALLATALVARSRD